MKPVASTLTEVDNLPGEEVKFSISDANSAWVMRSMADLYSNRELACVREYSTNAYDSNKEKAIRDGHDIAPIHVTLPSAMNPYFEVKDCGVGMSERELREVYTQFGESTKRDSDDFNGMLGFGSKSAIAYTNTFTVTSVKDGRKTVGVVTRREDAMGGYLVTLKIILSVATSESSGVTIQIPVHNWREFEHKAMDFYRFWEPGSVLVNGRQPEWAVGDKIDEGLYYNANAGTSYVVMGKVPYRINNPDALFPRGMNRISFVAYVPVGAVEFTPSREDLKYSEHTKKNLHKIIDDFVKKSVDMAKKEINSSTSHAEAYKNWKKWRNIIGFGQVEDLTFKGDKLVDNFPLDGNEYDTNAYRYAMSRVRHYSLDRTEHTYFITGFDMEVSTTHRRKVKKWLTATNRTARYVVFTAQTAVNTPWVDPAKVVSWEKVKAETPKEAPKPRSASVSWGRKAGSFDLITKAGRQNEKDVPSTKPLYYIMVQEYNIQKELQHVLAKFDLDYEVVLVPANRKDKFLRHYGHAQPVLPHLKTMVVLDGPSLITPDGQTYLSTNAQERMLIQSLDPTKVDDPEIRKLIDIMKKGEDYYTKDYDKNESLARILGLYQNFKRHSWTGYWDAKGKPLTQKYLLMDGVRRLDTGRDKGYNEHVYAYMNAVYKARKEGKSV